MFSGEDMTSPNKGRPSDVSPYVVSSQCGTCFRHVLHVIDHEVVPGEGFAELMADERLRRGLGR